MRIAVLGATGKTGRLVVEQALARGDQVVVYARDPREISASPGLSIIKGELSDASALTAALSGSDAVLVCLGTFRRKPIDLMQTSLPRIIDAMTRASVPRLVLLSAYGVGETARTAGFLARILYATWVRTVYRDKALAEALLPGSGLKWTRIYPVGLTNDPQADVVEVLPMARVTKVTGLPRVSRADVARVILDAAHNDQTVGETLLVSRMGTVS